MNIYYIQYFLGLILFKNTLLSILFQDQLVFLFEAVIFKTEIISIDLTNTSFMQFPLQISTQQDTNNSFDTQQQVAYIMSSIIQFIIVAGFGTYFFVFRKQQDNYKKSQLCYILVFYVSQLIGILLNPLSSYLGVILNDKYQNKQYKGVYLLNTFENIFQYTIPSFCIIISIVMFYNLYQNTKRNRNMIFGTLIFELIYIIIQFICENMCYFGYGLSDDQCPQYYTYQNTVRYTSTDYTIISIVFRLIPYLIILVLTLLTNVQGIVRMDFYELDSESNKLISLQRNKLNEIEQRRQLYIQAIIVFTAFLVENIYNNCIETFIITPSDTLCWAEIIFQITGVAIQSQVYLIKPHSTELIDYN